MKSQLKLNEKRKCNERKYSPSQEIGFFRPTAVVVVTIANKFKKTIIDDR